MASTLSERLEQLLASGAETAVLRFSLGNAYLATEPARAIPHLTRAVELDPQYSAAWKLLGKAMVATARSAEARAAFQQGIQVAETKGDVQAAKEMRVFLKRVKD
ncbi:MAG: tetratricopeptide repeat protein [Gammaproteobacteria bacterium]|nr:tetratricopeptide repeat protein [Gammaproteobacteria bacterium]